MDDLEQLVTERLLLYFVLLQYCTFYTLQLSAKSKSHVRRESPWCNCELHALVSTAQRQVEPEEGEHLHKSSKDFSLNSAD